MKEKKICKVPDCGKVYFCKGYCVNHYRKFVKYGDPLIGVKERHGMSHTPEYRTWATMIQRCTNPKDKFYYRYGGRGIAICQEWLNSFKAFYSDMGNRPSDKHQIDRIDGDKGYFKENCKWVLPVENMRHISTTKLSIQKAREIRHKYFDLNISQFDLSKEYNTTQPNIYCVIKNKTWKEGNNG